MVKGHYQAYTIGSKSNKKKVRKWKQPYPRNQRYRNYAKISNAKAQQIFDQRSKRAKTLDLKTTSKKVFDDPNEYWVQHIDRSDVKGIDTIKETKQPLSIREQELAEYYAEYYQKTMEKIDKPIQEKLSKLKKEIMDLERKGQRNSRFDTALQYPQESQKELVEEYKKALNKYTKFHSREFDLKLQKRWKRLKKLPELKENQKYYIVSVRGEWADHLSYTTDKEKAIKDLEINEIFFKKARPDLDAKIEIIPAKNIEDVRNQIQARGKDAFLITGDTYKNRSAIHSIAKVKFDYDKKGYRGKLSPEDIKELKKIPGLKIERTKPITKEDVKASDIAKAHSKSRKWLKHEIKEGNIWQKEAPFTKEEISSWNSLTHFPRDWNKDFKESVNKKEKTILKQLNIQKIEVAPEDVQNAFDYYRKNIYENIREKNRARQIAPPMYVVGPAKYPTHRIPKAEAIEKRASEKLEKAEKTLRKITYQYRDLKPRKSTEEIRQEYRDKITPKLNIAKKEGKKVFSLLQREWYPIERVNKKTITVKSKTGDYTFTIDKAFIKQVEGV